MERPDQVCAMDTTCIPMRQGFVYLTKALDRHGIRIRMDGKGCWRDNMFVEMRWKSIKYEERYPHAPATAHTKLSIIGSL